MGRILEALCRNTSTFTKEIAIVLDGCTDQTRHKVASTLETTTTHLAVHIVETGDVWETKANNVGIRSTKNPFVTIVQDDMLILEKDWDRKLHEVFKKHRVFAVSGRASHDFRIREGLVVPVNLHGREYPCGSLSLIGRAVAKAMAMFKPYFIYRYWSPVGFGLTANRGPLMLRRDLLESLGGFDEAFAPFELDDVDLCCRAYKRFSMQSASHPIHYVEVGGSKATSEKSRIASETAYVKNSATISARHRELSWSA